MKNIGNILDGAEEFMNNNISRIGTAAVILGSFILLVIWLMAFTTLMMAFLHLFK